MVFEALFHKKRKKNKEEKLEEVVKPDYYKLAMQDIEKEKEIEDTLKSTTLGNQEIPNSLQEVAGEVIDISALQEVPGISFFNPDYNLKIKNSLNKGGLRNICNQIEDLEYKYIGHEELGKIDSNPKGEVSPLTAELFDKVFMNRAFHKSLEGRLNNLNGSLSDYKEFYKKYLKRNNSKISYENRKNLLNSFEEVSRWIAGKDIDEVKEKICNINKYLLEEIKEEKAIDNSNILNKRIDNLVQEYNKELSNEQNPYHKFQSYVNIINNALDSVSDFDFILSNEAKINFHNVLTKMYAEIQENKNIDNSIRQETTKIYSEVFERLLGVTYEEAIKQFKKAQTSNISIS